MKKVVGKNEASKKFAESNGAFTEQLPYYRIKLGFNLAAYSLYKLGVSGPGSVIWVSIISYFLSGLLLFYLLSFLFPRNVFIAPLVSLSILVLPPLRIMGCNPCPDMFSFLFLIAFIITVLKKMNLWIVFLTLFCSVLIRPDYVLLAISYLLGMVAYGYFYKRKFDYILIIQGFLLAGVYIFIIKFYDYPGWKHLFFDSFIKRRPMLSAESPDFTVQQYLNILFLKFIYFKKITLAAIGLLIAIFMVSKDPWVRILTAVFFCNIYIKFIFFPDSGELRFFIGFVILLFCMLLHAVSEKYNTFQLRKIA